MIRSIRFVSFILVASCANYEGLFSPSYPACEFAGVACHRNTECCSSWCVNGACANREP